MHLQLNRSSQRKQSNLLRLLQERPGCSPSPTLSRWKGTSQGHIDCQLYLFASHMVLFCPCKGKGQRANYLSLCTNILEPNAQATLPSWQSPPPALYLKLCEVTHFPVSCLSGSALTHNFRSQIRENEIINNQSSIFHCLNTTGPNILSSPVHVYFLRLSRQK